MFDKYYRDYCERIVIVIKTGVNKEYKKFSICCKYYYNKINSLRRNSHAFRTFLTIQNIVRSFDILFDTKNKDCYIQQIGNVLFAQLEHIQIIKGIITRS